MGNSASKPIRVMIVDDHPMVRRGLVSFVLALPDLLLAGEAESGEAAVGLCRQMRPDVILMDMKLPTMSGAEAIRLIKREMPRVQIIGLSSFEDGQIIRTALQAGAIGYLLKDVSPEELGRAIRAAYAGQAMLSPAATRALVSSPQEAQDHGSNLSKRERAVLALMVEGLSNTQIAVQLVITPSTVKSHVSSILFKLGVASRTEAVSLALRRGLLD